MKKVLEDKRGDIPVMILVIGVVSLCLLTIMSFAFVISQINNNFYGIDSMEQMNILIDKYEFYKNVGVADADIALFLKQDFSEEPGIKYGLDNNYLFVNKTEWGVRQMVFSVKYYPSQ